MLNKYAALLKHGLKNKIRLTLGTIVAICISGTVMGATAPITITGDNTESVVINNSEGTADYIKTGTVVGATLNNSGGITVAHDNKTVNARTVNGINSTTFTGTLNNSGDISIEFLNSYEGLASNANPGTGTLTATGIKAAGTVNNSGNINLVVGNDEGAWRRNALVTGIESTGAVNNTGNVTIDWNNAGKIQVNTNAGNRITGIKGTNVTNTGSVNINVNNSGEMLAQPNTIIGIDGTGTVTNDGLVSIKIDNTGTMTGATTVTGIKGTTTTNNGIIDISVSGVTVTGSAMTGNATNNGIIVSNGVTSGVTTNNGIIVQDGVVTGENLITSSETKSANDLASANINGGTLTLTSGTSTDANINAIVGDEAFLVIDGDVILDNATILAVTNGESKSLINVNSEKSLTLDGGTSIIGSAQYGILAGVNSEINILDATMNLGSNTAVKFEDGKEGLNILTLGTAANVTGRFEGGNESRDILVLDGEGSGTLSNSVDGFENLYVQSGDWTMTGLVNLTAPKSNFESTVKTTPATGNLTIAGGSNLVINADADNQTSANVSANKVTVNDGGQIQIRVAASTFITTATELDLKTILTNEGVVDKDGNIIDEESGKIVVDKAYLQEAGWSYDIISTEDGLVLRLEGGKGPKLVGALKESVFNYAQSNVDEVVTSEIKNQGLKHIRKGNINSIISGKSNPNGVFAEVLGMYGEHGGGEFNPGYQYRTAGILVGASREINKNLTAGFTFGQTGSKIDYKDNERRKSSNQSVLENHDSRESIETFSVNGYLSYNKNNWLGTAFGGYSNSNHELNRNVFDLDLGRIGEWRELYSEFDSNVVSFGTELGYVVKLSDSSFLYPYAGLEYISYERDGYSEKDVVGDTATNMKFKAMDYSNVDMKLGVMGQKKWASWKFFGDASYVRATSDREDSSATFEDIRGDFYFDIPKLKVSKDTFKLAVGADVAWTESLSAGVTYSLTQNSDYYNHSLLAGLKYTW